MSKFLASLALVLCLSIPAQGQIFKRKVVRCANGTCRLVQSPAIHSPVSRVVVRSTARSSVGALSAGECSEQRQAWNEADQAANEAIIQRSQAKDAEQSAAADVKAAEEALAAAQSAHAAAQQSLNEATANVVDKTQAAEDAYKAWRICIIQ